MEDGKAESKRVTAEPEVGERTIARVIPEAQDTPVDLVNTRYITNNLATRRVYWYCPLFFDLHPTGSSWLHCEETQH